MKNIILSRKGFDSSAGGVASPIFDNGNIFSIPIPQKSPSPHKYKDLFFNGISGKDLLKESSAKSVTSESYCHFDPLLTEEIGIFGQANSSQTELKKQHVNTGDLFLFFGWFKQFSRKGKHLHHIFGWLQIDKVVEGRDNIITHLDQLGTTHPHGFGDKSNYPNNALYIGRERIDQSGINKKLPGYGVFKRTSSDLILTEKGKTRSHWRFPKKYFSKSKDLFLNRLKWKYLKTIKKGSVLSYSDVAKGIKKPGAVRAVANAIGKNPYAPKIPCHRVIRSDGSLGGYSGKGGIKTKKKLLKSEGILL